MTLKNPIDSEEYDTSKESNQKITDADSEEYETVKESKAKTTSIESTVEGN
jgi:hypothetical protein